MSIPKRRFFYFHFKGTKVRRLFKTWDEILRWYEHEDQDDLPYWYLERTNIGLLALAVYQLNGLSIQEFSIMKGKGARPSSGRADLYFHIPKSRIHPSSLMEFNIEAKQKWCSMGLSEDKTGRVIKNVLTEAIKDCRRIREQAWKARHGMGLIFILPYKKVDKVTARIATQYLSEFTQKIRKAANEVLANFAVVHYADIRTSLSREKCKKYDWCPGIAVIGKEI